MNGAPNATRTHTGLLVDLANRYTNWDADVTVKVVIY